MTTSVPGKKMVCLSPEQLMNLAALAYAKSTEYWRRARDYGAAGDLQAEQYHRTEANYYAELASQLANATRNCPKEDLVNDN